MRKKQEINVYTPTPAEKNAMDHEYEMDHQMVKGVFRNRQQKNNPIRFPFRKWLKDAIEWYPKNKGGKPQFFKDGETYEVPLMIANHLNNRCFREVHHHTLDANGKALPETTVGSRMGRFEFVNTDFRPVAGWKEPSPLVQVNKTLIM